MKYNFTCWVLLSIGLFLSADDLTIQTNKDQSMTLLEAIELSLANNPLIRRLQIPKEKAQLMQKSIRSRKILPVFNLSLQSGLVPEARGDIFDSPDKQADLDGWGPFYRLNIKFVQPVYYFGGLNFALKAAQSAVKFKGLSQQEDMEEFIFKVIQAYCSLSASVKGFEMAKKLQADYEKLLQEVEKRVHSEDSEVDDLDLLEVKSNRYQIEDIFLKSAQNRNIAETGFRLLLWQPQLNSVEVVPQSIRNLRIADNLFSVLKNKLLLQRYDLKKLQEADRIIEARMKVVSSRKKPAIYLAGGFGYAYAPHRSDQQNPFVYDSFNYLNLGLFFGLSWDLNFRPYNIETKKLQLDRQSIKQDSQLLRAKLDFELKQVYLQIEYHNRLLKEIRASLKSAKTWLRMSFDNWDMGIGEVNRIIRAYKAYYQLKGLEIKGEFELIEAMAKIAYLIGDSKLFIKWINHEKIFID